MKDRRAFQLLSHLALALPLVSMVAMTGAADGQDVSCVTAGGNENATPLKVDRLDKAIDQIIPANGRLERIATGFTWTEGPVWIDGALYFADIPANSIYRWTPAMGTALFLHPSGYTGSASFGGHEPGSNGMTLDPKGRLTVAGHARRDVYRLESLTPGAQVTILADTYEGKRLNSPNDLVYKSDGSLYFTDPPYGLPTRRDDDPNKQIRVNGVYRILHAMQHTPGAAPDRADLQLLISDLPRPNGIAFSPDEQYLYVNNTEPKKLWMRYRVSPDGTLTDAKLLYDATSDPRPGNPDGMKVDELGNLYSAGPGGVWIFSPEGKVLATILIPEPVANLAWGGTDRKMLYITAGSSVYRTCLNIAGAPLIRPRSPAQTSRF
jgi:gluconolactonase